jgi:hypothetical protein
VRTRPRLFASLRREWQADRLLLEHLLSSEAE